MGIVHFLNVNEGDCHVIQHPTGHTTVIDVCNASSTEGNNIAEATAYSARSLGVSGNFNQKASPTNPISYLENKGITSIFRYIQTHPDMDHMDGIRDLFEKFTPANFWDTENTKRIDGDFGKYSADDWKFYKTLRAGSEKNPKRLALYDGAKSPYFNQDEAGTRGGDGLHILAPTKELVSLANKIEDRNDSSYVILYRTKNKKILFPGDAHDETWAHLLENHADLLTNIDVLIAPHHGRDSSMDFSFLDTLKPKLTLFGNAKSKHLAYDKWASRGLQYVTNNQAGNIILDPDQDQYLRVFVSNFKFADAFANYVGGTTQYSSKHDAWSLILV